MKGRKATPRSIHELRGNPSKLRLKNPSHPVYEDGIPEPPPILNDDGLREWNLCVEQMTIARTITKLDGAALANHCWIYQEIIRLASELGNNSRTTFSERSKLAHTDERVKTIIKLQGMDARFLAELGMTPASRSKVSVVAGQRPPMTKEEKKQADLARKLWGDRVRPT